MAFFRTSLALAACLAGAWPAVARAEEPAVPHPHAYGIIVGSNAGGAGQKALQYAEDDAQKVADVLHDLGRYGTTDLRVLLHPDSAKILATLDEITAKVKEDQQRGEQATFVFYYSGHAKASALTLGEAELPLVTLRERLRQVPATLTLVVLDACQSGAFARTKGAEPAADFSYNSVSRLTTKGIAVMASSTGQELSQESDALKSSYFTHHLVVGLRGAGDLDGDGKVSLDEAYRYAYRRTLAATARTRVGMQHVTLETDLSGQGDVPVTYPADAKAQLEIPGPLDARVLVQHHASGSVVAELQKAPGAALKIALPAGAYDATIRMKTQILACALTLADNQVTAIELGTCQIAAANSVPKGWLDDDEPAPPDSPSDTPPEGAPDASGLREIDRWGFEAGFGLLARSSDDYTNRLGDFGYGRSTDLLDLPSPRVSLGVTRLLMPHVTLLLAGESLNGDAYERTVGTATDKLTFRGWGAGVYIRVHTDIVPRLFQLYGQAGGGASVAFSTLQTTDEQGVVHSPETQWAYLLGVAAGIAAAPDSRIGPYLQASYDHAPALANLLGDKHEVGGFAISLGARVRFGKARP